MFAQVGECAFLINLKSDSERMQRRLERRVKFGGRLDDSEENIKRKLDLYDQFTVPVVNYYNSLGKVREVCGSNQQDNSLNLIMLNIRQ